MAGKPFYDWPDDDDLRDLVHEKGIEKSAKKLGVAVPSLKSRLRYRQIRWANAPKAAAVVAKEVEVDDPMRVKMTQMDATIKALKKENKAYSEALADQEQFFNQIVEETRVPVKKPKLNKKRQSPSKPKMSALLPIYDQQFGQFVRPSDTPANRGGYSVEVFDERLARYVEAAKGILADKATAYNLDEMFIPMGGDHIEGDEIFAGQSWQLELDPPRQVWMLAEKMEVAIRDIVRFAKEEVGIPKIALYGVDDNHGKVGGKRGGARPATYSWNWLFLKILFDKLRAEPINQFAIEPGGSLFFRCASHEFQMVHGHNIRGFGGLPFYGLVKYDGRSIRLHNRIYRYLLMGHHHQTAEIPNGSGETIVSGDWVGANNLSGAINAASRPQQKILFVSEKWGIASTERVYFQDAHEAYAPSEIYEP